MLRQILVPLDGSELGEGVMPHAIAIAKASGAGLHLVHTFGSSEQTSHAEWGSYRRYLELIAQKLRVDHSLTVTTSVIEGEPAEALAAFAASLPADQIVLGTHGRGAFSRLWLGSVCDRLLRHCMVPMLAVKPKEGSEIPTELPRFGRILIPLDGSRAADAALAKATEFGKLFGAQYQLVLAVEPVPIIPNETMMYNPSAADGTLMTETARQGEAHLAEVAKRLRDDGHTVATNVTVGDLAAHSIIAAAKKCDLIVMATHGLVGWERLLWGSVADKVIRGSECPVLVVRNVAAT